MKRFCLSARRLQPVRDAPSSCKQQQHELQLSQLEKRAKLAEDRSQRNEALLNQKMLELSKLQGTLTQQTKVRVKLQGTLTQQTKVRVRVHSKLLQNLLR